MSDSLGQLGRMEAFIEKQRKLAEAEGDRRRSRANVYNATADVLFEHGYFSTNEVPSDDATPNLSQAIDSRIARLNTADALDALERVEVQVVAAARMASQARRMSYMLAGPLVVTIWYILAKLS